MVNFTFGQGVTFTTPMETSAIVPDILKRVWETDNNKKNVMWEIGQQGSVSGDVFIKVAYEELIDGKLVARKREYQGWVAEIIQHMIDHCNGKLV